MPIELLTALLLAIFEHFCVLLKFALHLVELLLKLGVKLGDLVLSRPHELLDQIWRLNGHEDARGLHLLQRIYFNMEIQWMLVRL